MSERLRERVYQQCGDAIRYSIEINAKENHFLRYSRLETVDEDVELSNFPVQITRTLLIRMLGPAPEGPHSLAIHSNKIGRASCRERV